MERGIGTNDLQPLGVYPLFLTGCHCSMRFRLFLSLRIDLVDCSHSLLTVPFF